MASFVALNIEPEEDSEDEIDDSKEIQIEEALKLYQIALKFQSQGPDSFNEAENAYTNLFASEVFTYPESSLGLKPTRPISEVERPDDLLENPLVDASALPATGSDGAPSTLPQILYLSYKNKGQFMLDRLKDSLLHSSPGAASSILKGSADYHRLIATLSSSLRLFADALERDDTDVELWRLVSRICGYLGSQRIARYCLESALTTDESNLNASSEHLSLDQTIATQQLHVLLHAIYDRTSEPQFVFKPKIRSTIATLNKFLDPCPYLPIPWQEVSNSVAEYIQRGLQIGSQEIRVPLRTWTNCGKALMIQFGQDAQHLKGTLSGANYSLVLPAKRNSSEEMTSKQRRIDLTFPKDIIAEKGPLLLENSVTIDSDRNNNSQVDGLIQDTSLPCMVADAYNDVSMRASEVDIRLKDSVHIQQSGSQVPVISNDDDIQTRAEASITIGDTVSLPTRKRSSDSAGMQENADTGRSRSKRIKARGLMAESNSAKDDTLVDRSQHYNDLLQSQHQADYWLFEAVGSLLSKFGADRLGPLASLQEIMSTPQPPDISHQSSMLSNLIDTAARDLRNNLLVWNTEKSNTLIRNDGLDLITSSRNSALTVFLEHSKRETPSQRKVLPDDEGLEAFTEDIRQNWTYLDQLALKWVEALLSPRSRDESQNIRVPSTYEEYLWPETLKHAVVQMLVMKDEFIYIELLERVKILDQRLLESNKDRPSERLQTSEENLIVAVQNIFELHLDVHNSIISPSSEVDVPTRELQLDRLGRWAALARDAITKLPSSKEAGVVQDHLEIRSLWSSVLHISLIDPSARDHIVACFRDLQHILMDAGNPKIELFNNGVMPEVSAAAAESEISRLTTMDFFLGIFSPEQSNHLAVIESLGPILERSVRKEDKLFESTIDVEAEPGNAVEFKGALSSQNNANETDTDFLDSQVQQMLRFLDGANISLKLLLWQKLSDAYGAIKYPPQVLSCNLRCVEIIVDHLELTLYKSSVNRTRRSDLIYWIRILGNIIEKALMQILDVPNVFEFIDEDHLHSSMKAVAACQRLLWIIILWEDSVLVGQTQSSRPSNVPGSTLFDKGFDILHTILVNTWLLQYNLVKEAFEQSNQGSNAYNEYLLDYLKLLHRALGLRHCCNSSNKLFLKYMKGEILRLDPTESSSNDMAQLVYDLYGLKISPIATELENHQCNPASLDRETAFEVMDLVMAQASKTNIKDLGKSELKATIDKMQQAIKVPKPTPMMLFNRRIINNFLKSPINPVDLYRSLKGIGDLNGALVDNVATLGDRGWYFLLGHLSLVKHRSQKRTSAGPIDDLDIATAFFRQDLELGVEKWETWYRLAQVYDAKIEEDVTWTAEKLNNDTGDLRGLQRSAIHCYAIAVAIAIRSADASFETVSKISELYIDFAFRVFSSTREPFSMDAFSLKDFVKHYNGEKRGMYEGRPFCDMQLYPAWKFVCALLRRALVHKSGSWMVYYMLGKCQWKMYNCNQEFRGKARRISYMDVLDAYSQAIRLLPERRDNKHTEKDPTLEPHYKLVTTVHKLVRSRRITPEAGCTYLNATPYACKIPAVQDPEDWEGYLLHVLKALRSADKANWHHRMVARAAHTIYDESPGDIMAALGAKHELTQQIFTKTMDTRIWKPDNERPGRHFVYTSRYVVFLVRLLTQLNDRSGLEALARRIRKKPGDFFNHTGIWEEVCIAYLKLLRRHGSILEGNEDLVFKTLPHAVFLQNAERMENWAHSMTETSQILDLLREVVELKKLNANLIKSAPIEDLVGDTYANLYESIVPQLITKSNAEENRVRMRVDHLLMKTNPVPDEPSIEPLVLITKAARPKSVGRREIQRKAEALVAKPPLLTIVPSIKPITISSETQVLTAIAIMEKDSDQTKASTLLTVREREDVGKDISSVPGSLHDSADDESELSEIEDGAEEGVADYGEADGDEDGGAKMLFPNLSAKGSKAGDGDEDKNREVEDEDEDEEENGSRMEVDEENGSRMEVDEE